MGSGSVRRVAPLAQRSPWALLRGWRFPPLEPRQLPGAVEHLTLMLTLELQKLCRRTSWQQWVKFGMDRCGIAPLPIAIEHYTMGP